VSVLLDALKKAAEEKNNKTANAEDNSASEYESTLEVEVPVKPKIETPVNNDVVSGEDVSADTVLSSEALKEPDNLPLFTLKDPSTEHNDSDINDVVLNSTNENPQLNDSDSISLQLQAEPANNGMSIESSNDGELSDLINSLDISSPEQVLDRDLDQKNGSPNEMSTGVGGDLSLTPDSSQTLNYSVDQELPTEFVGNETKSKEDDFNWSMDNLPGYVPENSGSSEPSIDSLSQNPILINGENKPPKIEKKSSTSVRVIVSLVVILLFIGIGFYGMLYYQEQNDELEFSMKRYNLTKMKLPSDKVSGRSYNPDVTELEESPSLTASITDKIINVGEAIKNKVSNEVANEDNKPLNLSEAKDVNLTALNDINPKDRVVSKTVQGTKTKSKPQFSSRQGVTKSQKVYTQRNKLSKNPNRESPSNVYKSDSKTATVVVSTARSFVSKAYDAYQSGNFNQAKTYFSEALDKDANNINAMLGLAGVSVAQKKYYSAVNLYQQVLDKDANNLYAFEAIANLSGMVDLNSQWEKELSSMAKKYPNSAVLQYALGNHSAKKKDWLAAQDKYFNAYALDTSNPDYMVNLAVSFDHLGKYELAAKYYTQALGFSETKSISFDSNKVRDRLVSIRQFIVKGQ